MEKPHALNFACIPVYTLRGVRLPSGIRPLSSQRLLLLAIFMTFNCSRPSLILKGRKRQSKTGFLIKFFKNSPKRHFGLFFEKLTAVQIVFF